MAGQNDQKGRMRVIKDPKGGFMFDAVRWLLALCLVIGSLLLYAAMDFEQAHVPSAKHPDFSLSVMEVGGPRSEEDIVRWNEGLVFGIVVIVTLTATLLVGVDSSSPEIRRFRFWILGVGLIYVLTFVAMMLSWREYAADSDRALWGPFPAPVTWMVFGVWLVPGLFTVIYVAGFQKWFVDGKVQTDVCSDVSESTTERTN
jgi:hypothetical protein